MLGLAVVDYDNVCGQDSEPSVDPEPSAVDLVDTLASAFAAEFPAVTELDVRFYGGWIDESGAISPSANKLIPIMPRLRGRYHSLIVRPSLALAMVQFPEEWLKGTVRLRSRQKRQKMVDGMIGCDAIFVAGKGVVHCGLVTDDDDLVPAALSAHTINPHMFAWMRPRPMGNALNDGVFAKRGLRVRQFKGG